MRSTWLIACGSVLAIACTASPRILDWRDSGPDAPRDASTGEDSATPSPCSEAACFVEIAAAFGHTCARRADGRLMCWGTNGSGQLGTGQPAGADTPVFAMIDSVSRIAVGTFHTCVIRAGAAWCFGANGRSQSGGEETEPITIPRELGGTPTLVEITLGEDASCALDEAGGAWCWGANFVGQLGIGRGLAGSATPLEVALAFDASALTGGLRHFCAANESRLGCWGANEHGALGDETVGSPQYAPTNGTAANGVLALGGGGDHDIGDNSGHTCAVIDGGRVRCWGRGEEGQLGDGKLQSSTGGVDVALIADALEVDGGASHTCALSRNGQVRCWGANAFGQLGDGSMDARAMPALVMGIDDAVSISAGVHHSCAVRETGAALCWGDNQFGQLGDGTRETSPVPVEATVLP